MSPALRNRRVRRQKSRPTTGAGAASGAAGAPSPCSAWKFFPIFKLVANKTPATELRTKDSRNLFTWTSTIKKTSRSENKLDDEPETLFRPTLIHNYKWDEGLVDMRPRSFHAPSKFLLCPVTGALALPPPSGSSFMGTSTSLVIGHHMFGGNESHARAVMFFAVRACAARPALVEMRFAAPPACGCFVPKDFADETLL
ncbi:hypothetical protein EVAR_50492_1 [Eumeta japonica]|uniref:Uncharacterized protein n=1 Tax=Eumeta variegata TaxID=151549 RepID=A0A4C1XWR1_EUMVA|nr:hypothetical protein EVAR_50492_1 [Eumeta japonica]